MDRSGTQLTLTVDWPEITLDKLTRLTSLWSNVIHAVSAEAAGKRDALKWVLTGLSFASPVQVQTIPVVARTRVDPVVLRTVSHAVVAGVRQLGHHSERPDHFSTHALELMRKLALLSDDGSVVVSNGVGDPVPITHRVAATVDDILGPEVESYGSVEGHLEGIFTHGRRVLYVLRLSQRTPGPVLLRRRGHAARRVAQVLPASRDRERPRSIEGVYWRAQEHRRF